jgi:hypothetical protein
MFDTEGQFGGRERAFPVVALRDGRGVYGVGVSRNYKEETETILGFPVLSLKHPEPRRDLILRPDRLYTTPPGRWEGGYYAALQKIAGGFRRRGPYVRTGEEQLRQVIHHEALKRAGLPWPPPWSFEDWWSTDSACSRFRSSTS